MLAEKSLGRKSTRGSGDFFVGGWGARRKNDERFKKNAASRFINRLVLQEKKNLWRKEIYQLGVLCDARAHCGMCVMSDNISDVA